LAALKPTGPVDGPVLGGFLTGVASTVDKPSIRVYNGGKKYNQWEFIWNPVEDQAKAVQQGLIPVRAGFCRGSRAGHRHRCGRHTQQLTDLVPGSPGIGAGPNGATSPKIPRRHPGSGQGNAVPRLSVSPGPDASIGKSFLQEAVVAGII
jgi:hypothetical protein